MEHILEHYVTFANSNLRGFVFGFVHVAIHLARTHGVPGTHEAHGAHGPVGPTQKNHLFPTVWYLFANMSTTIVYTI